MVELFYGISVPDNVDFDQVQVDIKQYYTDKTEVMKVLKQLKSGRFKVFKSKEEAIEFSETSSTTDLVKPNDAILLSSPKPSEKCEFKSLKPQEEVKFRKAIESNPSDLVFLSSCIEDNARYLVTPSDTPTILQQGQRHNALHVAARHGKYEAAQLVLSHVTGDLMSRMYPEEDRDQNSRRRHHLVDMYLNMPDKGGGDTPLHLAVKFGNIQLVRLLCSYHQTRLDMENKFGELAGDVVCSRAKTRDHEADIREILGGQVVIPVYTKPDEPTKVLGKPISLREASELLETSVMSDLNTSQSSLSSSITSLSPLVQSTRARMVSMSPMSPLVTSSSISAVMGPVPSSQAKNLYRRWRTGGGSEGDGDMAASRQRLEDPLLGVERQGREIANKEKISWIEYWPWLGEFLDLSSESGLQVLEEYLEEKTRSIREKSDQEYQHDIDDEFEASIAVKNPEADPEDNVFSGELELVSSSTPAKLNTWTSYRGSDDTDNSLNDDLDNPDVVLNITDKNGNKTNIPDPLSPLSSLMNGFGSLNLASDADVKSKNPGSMMNLTTPPTKLQHSLSNEVMRHMEQFVSTMVNIVSDTDPDTSDNDWVQPLVSHWSVLRRQVNNWRSDPLGRWSGLDWDHVASTLVSMASDQVTMEVGLGLDREKVARMMERVAMSAYDNTLEDDDDHDDDEVYGRGRRRRLSSNCSVTGVREIAKLFSLVSRSLLDPDNIPDPVKCGSVWDLDTEKTCVNTDNVNRARRFLHSGSSTSSNSVSGGDVSNIVNINKVSDPVMMMSRRLSVSSQDSQDSQDEWMTPPCSPGASSIASMETCSEGLQVWICGDVPSLQDRRLGEALSNVSGETLTRYPHVSWYWAQLTSYTRDQQMTWPEYDTRVSVSHMFGGLARKLDLDFTI